MVRDVSYAYSIDGKIRAYIYAVVFYFSVRMHSRNAVQAAGSARLTCIHEYRISCNRSLRLVLERCRLSWHVLEEIRSAAAGPSAQHRLQQVLLGLEFSQNQSSCFANFPKTPTWLLKPNTSPKSPRIVLSKDTFAEPKYCEVSAYESETFHRRRSYGISHCENGEQKPPKHPLPVGLR